MPGDSPARTFIGDASGIAAPADPAALARMGPDFLTRAFRACGALARDNAVSRIVACAACPGGSTGAKLFVDVAYRQPGGDLPEQLFVKFSRDFNDTRRDDQGRWEMAGEVRFARLTRRHGMPVAVPRALFADFEAESGSGLIITERIAFGEDGIEPHRRKCMDHRTLDDPVAHYRAVIRSLARLAGAHRSGALGPDIDRHFPFDPASASADPIRQDRAGLLAALASCRDFARDCPRLLPEELRSDAFHEGLRRDALRLLTHEAAIRRALLADRRLVALCHWNAHIDNCWFRRDEGGDLVCGLIDWGRVGQLTFGSVLWGALSAAHHDVWDRHLDDLLGLFAAEYHAAGGPLVAVRDLRDHLILHVALMGVARVLAFPEIIRFRLPQCVEAAGPHDAMFDDVDPARNCLHIYTVFLKLWKNNNIGEIIARVAE